MGRNHSDRSPISHLFKFNTFTELAYLMSCLPIDTIAALPAIYFPKTRLASTASSPLFSGDRVIELARSLLSYFASIGRGKRPLFAAFHPQLLAKLGERRKNSTQPTIRDINNIRCSTRSLRQRLLLNLANNVQNLTSLRAKLLLSTDCDITCECQTGLSLIERKFHAATSHFRANQMLSRWEWSVCER